MKWKICTRRDVRTFAGWVKRDWKRLLSVFGLTAIILPLLSLVLPSGRTANGWQSGVFFLGFMTLFSVNLCVACAPSKREEA